MLWKASLGISFIWQGSIWSDSLSRSLAAVDAEEKGEKFRIGDKARRFYEQALELYRRAASFSKTYDAVYNR